MGWKPMMARSWPALAMGTATGIAAIVASTCLTGSIAETTLQPEVATRLWPLNAEALAQQASNIMQSGQKRDAPTAVALARRSLILQSVNPVAARTLGLAQVMDGHVPQAVRSFHYAESVSRRDIPTQLWLIEEAVAAGDVPRALQHYNRALSTSTTVSDSLFPVLMAATATPTVSRSLSVILARRPIWWRAFVERLVIQYPSPEAVAMLLRAVRLDSNLSDDQPMLVAASQHLVDSGREDLARSLLPGHSADLDTVTNGDFEHDPGLPPFDWRLTDAGEFGAAIQSAAVGSGHALFLRSQNATAGELAREFVSLHAGQRYRVGFTYGDMPDNGGADVGLSCTGSGRSLLAIPIPSGSGHAQGDLVVPAECHGQWLIIVAEPRFETGSGRDAWIDDMHIQLIPNT